MYFRAKFQGNSKIYCTFSNSGRWKVNVTIAFCCLRCHADIRGSVWCGCGYYTSLSIKAWVLQYMYPFCINRWTTKKCTMDFNLSNQAYPRSDMHYILALTSSLFQDYKRKIFMSVKVQVHLFWLRKLVLIN